MSSRDTGKWQPESLEQRSIQQRHHTPRNDTTPEDRFRIYGGAYGRATLENERKAQLFTLVSDIIKSPPSVSKIQEVRQAALNQTDKADDKIAIIKAFDDIEAYRSEVYGMKSQSGTHLDRYIQKAEETLNTQLEEEALSHPSLQTALEKLANREQHNEARENIPHQREQAEVQQSGEIIPTFRDPQIDNHPNSPTGQTAEAGQSISRESLNDSARLSRTAGTVFKDTYSPARHSEVLALNYSWGRAKMDWQGDMRTAMDKISISLTYFSNLYRTQQSLNRENNKRDINRSIGKLNGRIKQELRIIKENAEIVKNKCSKYLETDKEAKRAKDALDAIEDFYKNQFKYEEIEIE